MISIFFTFEKELTQFAFKQNLFAYIAYLYLHSKTETFADSLSMMMMFRDNFYLDLVPKDLVG